MKKPSKKNGGINLSSQLENCENQWAALSPDMTKVISCDHSMERAIEKAKMNGEDNPVMMKVPSKSGSYLF